MAFPACRNGVGPLAVHALLADMAFILGKIGNDLLAVPPSFPLSAARQSRGAAKEFQLT